MMKKIVWRVLIVVAVVMVLAIGGFVAWALNVPPIMAEATQALTSDSNVEVTQGQWIAFAPANPTHDIGVIFYPGGRVDARAYAPIVRSLAEQGYPSFIVPVTLNLALLSPNVAQAVIDAHPNIERWVVGGHSLGGIAASQFVGTHAVDGLFLQGSYSLPDLSASDVAVLVMMGTQDGLIPPEEVRSHDANLPDDAVFHLIDGGNHAQFGWYGEQAGDNPATISRTEQQAQVLTALLDWLGQLE